MRNGKEWRRSKKTVFGRMEEAKLMRELCNCECVEMCK